MAQRHNGHRALGSAHVTKLAATKISVAVRTYLFDLGYYPEKSESETDRLHRAQRSSHRRH